MLLLGSLLGKHKVAGACAIAFGKSLTALLFLMLACDPIIKLLTWQQREMA